MRKQVPAEGGGNWTNLVENLDVTIKQANNPIPSTLNPQPATLNLNVTMNQASGFFFFCIKSMSLKYEPSSEPQASGPTLRHTAPIVVSPIDDPATVLLCKAHRLCVSLNSRL